MVSASIIILIGSFLLYVILRQIHRYIADLYLFIIFIFAYIVSNREFSAFYLILFLIAILIDIGVEQINISPTKEFKIGKTKLSGFGFSLASIGFGAVIYLIIALISTRVGGNIVGVPNLAISSTSEIAHLLKPVFESSLGIVENRFAFVMYELLLVVGLLPLLIVPILSLLTKALPFLVPILVSGIVMGIFHVAAYNVSFSLILWSSFAFILFIVSYSIMRDSLAADTAHFINNALVSISRGLQIIT